MSGPQLIDADVRVSREVGGPVTFGSTILVPPQFSGWDAKKRLAVLAHEGAHVANRDFYVLLLASLNRAVFWFSPFSWWQLARLAELAEIISDAQAIEVIDDRWSYAEILLDVATSVKPRPVELAMARASTVRARVERIIAAAAHARRGRLAQAAVDRGRDHAGRDRVRRHDRLSHPGPRACRCGYLGEAPAQHYRPFVNFYAMGPASVFAIFREGDDLYGQLTGQRRLRLTVGSDGTAAYRGLVRRDHVPARCGAPLLRADAAHERPRHARGSRRRDADGGRRSRIARSICRLVQDRAEPGASPCGATAIGFRCRKPCRAGQRGPRRRCRRLLHPRRQSPDLPARRAGEGLARAGPERGVRRPPRAADRCGERRRRSRRTSRAALAEVPDRFREQVPVAGGKEMILRGIEDLRARHAELRSHERAAGRQDPPPARRNARDVRGARRGGVDLLPRRRPRRLRHLWRQVRERHGGIPPAARARRQGRRRDLPGRRQ